MECKWVGLRENQVVEGGSWVYICFQSMHRPPADFEELDIHFCLCPLLGELRCEVLAINRLSLKVGCGVKSKLRFKGGRVAEKVHRGSIVVASIA